MKRFTALKTRGEIVSRYFPKTALLFMPCLLSAPALAKALDLDTLTVFGKISTSPSFNTEPISKTEFYQQELIERGINDLTNMTQQIANLHLTSNGAGSYGQNFSLRGLTNTALFSAPAVVVYVDDVPYSS